MRVNGNLVVDGDLSKGDAFTIKKYIADTTIAETITIPQTARDLHIFWNLRNARATATDTIRMQFNGDTGNNYFRHYWGFDEDATKIASFSTADDEFFIGHMNATNGDAGEGGSVSLLIPNYRDTRQYKSVIDTGNITFDADASEGSIARYLAIYAGMWLSTSAITSITVDAHPVDLPTYVAGSTIWIRGYT